MDKKVAIVTGAAKGIGKAIAIEFAKLGMNIVLNYNSTKPDDTIQLIKSLNVECIAVKANISNGLEAKNIIKEAKDAFGRIDVLVNNAGITKDGLLMSMSEEDFMDVININLKGTFNMTSNVIKIMSKQKSGSIINISSVIGISGNAGQSNYAASKAGVIGFTKSVAKEYAKKGITCNAIAPGFIKSDMTDCLNEKIINNIIESIPMKKIGTPEDVARCAVFLAQQTYITGEVIKVDGGLAI